MKSSDTGSHYRPMADEDMMDLDPPTSLSQEKDQNMGFVSRQRSPVIDESRTREFTNSNPSIQTAATLSSWAIRTPTQTGFTSRSKPLGESRELELAPPRFYASQSSETGLESLFDGIFSLSDQPVELRKASNAVELSKEPGAERKTVVLQLTAVNGLASTMLIAACACMFLAERLDGSLQTLLRISALWLTIATCALSVLKALGPWSAVFSLSDVLFHALHGGLAVYFSRCQQEYDKPHASTFVYASAAIQMLLIMRTYASAR